MKRYMSKSAAKRAIDKAGLGAMAVEYDVGSSGVVTPVVFCMDAEDAAEVRKRGFDAIISVAKAKP